MRMSCPLWSHLILHVWILHWSVPPYLRCWGVAISVELYCESCGAMLLLRLVFNVAWILVVICWTVEPSTWRFPLQAKNPNSWMTCCAKDSTVRPSRKLIGFVPDMESLIVLLKNVAFSLGKPIRYPPLWSFLRGFISTSYSLKYLYQTASPFVMVHNMTSKYWRMQIDCGIFLTLISYHSFE